MPSLASFFISLLRGVFQIKVLHEYSLFGTYSMTRTDVILRSKNIADFPSYSCIVGLGYIVKVSFRGVFFILIDSVRPNRLLQLLYYRISSHDDQVHYMF